MKRLTWIITIVILMFSSTVCFADTNNVKVNNFDNDIKMSGVISSTEKFFSIDDIWKVEEAKLNLVLTKSELLDVDHSTITIFVNDTPISSLKLDGKKQYKKEVVVNIPIDALKVGYNKIAVKAYKTIDDSDMICRDDSNIANWLVLHKESNINIKYSYKEGSNLLSNFNSIYFREDNGSRLSTSILLSDNHSSAELTAAMIFSANFGEKRKFDNVNFDVNSFSTLKNKNDNIIYIGRGDNAPKEVLSLLSNDEKALLNDNCVIKQVESPFNKKSKMLILLSNNNDLLIKGSKLITSNDLIKNLNYATIAVNKDNDVYDIVDSKDYSKMYLKDLGYDNLMVKGPFNQEIIFDINIPKNKVVSEGSKIKFDVRYAENLDFDRSLMTVYLNEIPIGSKRLYLDKANNDVFEATIPKELLGKSYYQVKVAFDLNVKDLQCVTRDTDNPWAYIANTSFVEFNYDDNGKLTFKNYPYPFVLNDKFNDVKVIVPDVMEGNDLNNISSIISYIGRDAKYNTGNIEVIKASEFNKDDNKANIIIYGTQSNNVVLRENNQNLKLRFKEDFSGFESNDKIKFIGEYPSQITSIQLMKSPFNDDFGAMVIAATDSNDLSLAARYLNDLSLTKSLEGDVIVIDRNGNIEDLNYEQEKIADEKTEDESIKDKVKLNDERKLFIIVVVVLFVIIGTVTVLMVRKYKK